METTVEKPQKKHKKRAAKASEVKEPVEHSRQSEDGEACNTDTNNEHSSPSKVKNHLPEYDSSADSHSSAKTEQSEESQRQHCSSQSARIAEEMKEQTNPPVDISNDLAHLISDPKIGNISMNPTQASTSLTPSVPIPSITDEMKEQTSPSVCVTDDLAQAISNLNVIEDTLINTNEAPSSLPQSIPFKVREHNEFEKYLVLNKHLLNTLESIPTKSAYIAKDQTVLNVARNCDKLSDCCEIQPYTEHQLEALYFNTEFNILEEFTNTFIQTELKSQQLKKAYLYELLVNYLNVREKITGNNIELAQLRDEYRNLQTVLWTTDVASVTGRAACHDGKIVQASQEYHRSVFDRSGFQSLVMVLSKMQKLIYDQHVLYSFRAEDLRLQIRSYIAQLIDNILNASKLNVKSPVSLLVTGHELSHIQVHLNELRLSVSILFAFQRKLIKEPIFLKDTRDWLSQLVAVLIRLANYQDHLFLLHHILRCPARVSSWACQFVQVPLCLPVTEPFANYEINHLLTMLSVILSPVKERSEFLKDIAHTQNVSSETSWVVIDSDGEEDEEPSTSLRENDLVAIINQLPLQDMFRAILYVTRSDDKDDIDPNVITEQHILRYFAFSSVLLRLLRQGLETYCLPKYNQLSKRLSRLIRHVVQYATDQWEVFIKNGNIQDKAMVQRLQTEYDAFFLRAIYYLYTSQKQWAWQFLAVVPYNMVTLSTLWKIHYFLHMPDSKAEDIVNFKLSQNFKELVSGRELIEQFEEKLPDLDDAEIYYLLNTFANMALARDERDLDFIYFCTLDILQIGFISQTTQESCSKSARILLAHLTSKYPCLLSTIMKTVYDNMDKIGHLALYLYEEIPLTIWKVSDEDFHLIGRLLMNHSVNSDQSKLSRMILSRLNWDNILYEKHCETAVLVLKAVDQEPSYLQWGWQTILRLKLHISDHHFQEIGRIQEPERCEILMKGIRENHPLSSFVAVLMTSWGHLVPLICSHGLNQLCTIQFHQKHEAVLFALYQIVPVFISCQECLINSSKFQEILMNLINADRGYISYAKSFIVTQNTVLQQFGNMIETQIVNYSFYDFHSPRLLVRLWMNSLISIPNWNNDKAILYLLDVVIRTAFPYPDALQVVHENFRDICLNSTQQESNSIISKLKWSSASTKSSYGLLSGSLAQYPWLAYVFFEVEHQEKEVKTGLWTEVLKSLSEQKGKISVDNAIKNVALNLKLPVFTSSYLCIYRYAQQAMDTDMEHPLLPLFWQRFFILYLFRLPQLSSTGQICVGERFFEGIVNFSFLKKLKRRLQDSIDHYRSEIETSSEVDNTGHKEHEKLLYSVFRAFLLWLEEPRLQSGNLLLQSLPSQYEPQLLSLIIHENNQTPWYNYVNRDQIMKDQATSIRHWRVANFREKSNINQPLLNPGHGIESPDPIERIFRRLASYDAIQPPPVIEQLRVDIPQTDLSGKEEMFKSLKPSFDTLVEFAHAHNQNVSNNKGLDSTYKELVPQLFTSVMKRVKKHIPCKGKNQTILCCGPAIITLEFQEAKRNERIDHAIQVNRQSYESLVERSLQTPAESLYTASVSIQQCVRILQDRIKINRETTELGVELFYHILSYLQDELLMYLPAKTLFASCIEKLGRSHICGVENEMPRLLELILKEPNLGAYLAPYFLPKNCGNSNMLFMYSTIIKNVPSKYDVLFALISKFDIENWLNIKSPNLNQRSKLIENIVYALSELGFDPPVEALALHTLYRKHLVIVFKHQFPEHYGEILTKLLKTSIESSENNQISETVWIDIITSLANPSKINVKVPLRDQLREYAQHQKMLSHDELLGTCTMLAQFFTQERLAYGLYGLYPKCRNYINVFALLLEMGGHGLIVSMLNAHQGLLGDKLCEKIWPYIRDMYAPWLIPYSTNNMKDDMANWIQQLTDDRSILLPWIQTDSELADIMLTSFCQCVTFLLDTLPASFNILSYLFQWYVISFGHPAVKTHVLTRIHKAFTTFPWIKFWPSLMDVDFMLKVVDQYLPECHSFLGHIFVEIPWATWISTFNDAPQQIKNRVYYCFLNILVKLSIEPKGRKNNLEKGRSIIVQAENFDWGNLEPLGFQHIMDWVVMSYDSSVIFKNDILDLDYRLLCLLKLVSGYNKVLPQESEHLIAKRHTFIKAHRKLLSVYVSRNRNMINSSGISALINGQLDDLDLVVTTNSEFEVLAREILSVINISDISECTFKVTLKWIESKTYGLAVKSLLKILGPTITNSKYLGKLCEAALVSYFNTNILENNMEEPTWEEASELLHVCVSKPNDFEQALLEEAAILTLNAILLQRIRRNINTENLFNICLSWHEKIKLKEPLESKFPLLWLTILSLSIQYCEKDESIMATQLHKFSHILLQFSEDSGSNRWTRGFLNVIGFSKSDEVTLNFRFICRAMAGYVLAQLPDMKALPRKVRTVANAPCSIGTPGGNPECAKILLELDFGQSTGKIKDCAQYALTKIQDPHNSLHNAREFLMTLLKQFYSSPYIKSVDC